MVGGLWRGKTCARQFFSIFPQEKIQLPLHKEAFLGYGLELHTCKLKMLLDKLCLWVYNYFEEGLGNAMVGWINEIF